MRSHFQERGGQYTRKPFFHHLRSTNSPDGVIRSSTFFNFIMMTMNKGSCNRGLYCSVLETEARRMERLDFDGVSLQSLKKLKSFKINTVFAKIFSVEDFNFFCTISQQCTLNFWVTQKTRKAWLKLKCCFYL